MTNLNETLEQRGEQYGDFRQMAEFSQELKNLLLTDQMTAVQREVTEMICVKLARIVNGNPNHRDSWLDIAGYAQLVVNDIDRGGE